MDIPNARQELEAVWHPTQWTVAATDPFTGEWFVLSRHDSEREAEAAKGSVPERHTLPPSSILLKEIG